MRRQRRRRHLITNIAPPIFYSRLNMPLSTLEYLPHILDETGYLISRNLQAHLAHRGFV